MFLYQFLSTQALINKSVSYDGYVRGFSWSATNR